MYLLDKFQTEITKVSTWVYSINETENTVSIDVMFLNFVEHNVCDIIAVVLVLFMSSLTWWMLNYLLIA